MRFAMGDALTGAEARAGGDAGAARAPGDRALGHPVTLIRGDGAGPELIDATIRAIAATGVRVAWDEQVAGTTALERHGSGVAPELLESFRRTRIGLKGPLETPVGSGSRSFNAELRRELDLFASVRPCRETRPGLRRCDFVVIRENHEDLYAGIELAAGSHVQRELAALVERHRLGTLAEDAGVSLKVITRRRSERVLRYAFEHCRRHARPTLTVGHKANVLVETDLLFLRTARELAAEYPDVDLRDRLIDSLCADLVRRPEAFDAIVLPNLYGDIVSDVGAALIGGVGLAPSMNVGDGVVVFEAVHGVVRRHAQRDRANPLALLRCGAMLLRELGEHAAGRLLDDAVARVAEGGSALTLDLTPERPASTSAVVERVLAEIASGRACMSGSEHAA